MIKPYIVLLAVAMCSPLGASVQVPEGLRNPFEVPDPVIKQPKQANMPMKDAAAAAREAAFARVKDKLYSLPVRGIITEMKNASGGDVTVLFGSYTIRAGVRLPASDFDIKGIVQITSVTPTEIVVSVSIELETRKMTISLAR